MADSSSTDMDKRKEELAKVRARINEETSTNRKKKGFMTPVRKKKLRQLLMKNFKMIIMDKQEKEAKKRREIIETRCGQKKPTENLSDAELKALCQEYHQRICNIQATSIDMKQEVGVKDYEIDQLNIAVNNLRGKFIKPSLKKVSKYENKFAKLQKKAAEYNIRNQLKTVKKKEFSMDEEEKTAIENKKPDWALDKTKSAHDLMTLRSEEE